MMAQKFFDISGCNVLPSALDQKLKYLHFLSCVHIHVFGVGERTLCVCVCVGMRLEPVHPAGVESLSHSVLISL